MLKQYLLSPTCMKCGSLFCNESLFCLVCLKNEVLLRSKNQKESHLGLRHNYLLEWNKGESDVLSQMVYRLKSDNALPAWQFYAKFFYKKIKKKINFKQFHALIPVPSINPRSVHAMFFAQQLSLLTGLPVKDVLIKKSDYTEQKALSAHQRKTISTIEVKEELNEHFTKCIFIDDIVTTGESFLQSNKALNGGSDSLILSLFYRTKQEGF